VRDNERRKGMGMRENEREGRGFKKKMAERTMNTETKRIARITCLTRPETTTT
jgi:hypothetical protein